MPGPNAQGTFTTTSTNGSAGVAGDTLIVPTSTTALRLTIDGLDGSNTVKTQKRTVPSAAFADQVTYNSNQSNVSVPAVAGEEWRLQVITQQASKDIRYKLSCES